MSLSAKPNHRAWWKECSVYQIWPASFKDSNDDGIGDIPGIISQLDYIKNLGVDIVWLCPSYKSPQVDMGYDIADYYSIADEYGAVADVENLIQGCHQRGVKLLMDLVVNHTSDQHEWFKQSRSSKDNEYRNWYIWKPAKYDEQGNRHPPNNWVSHFQGIYYPELMSYTIQVLTVDVQVVHGSMTNLQTSTICTCTPLSSPISIGSTLRCARQSTTSSAFGSTRAVMASEWT